MTTSLTTGVRATRTALLSLFGLAFVAACTYNPPPEVTLVAPPNNTFAITEPIVLQFSEAIEPESLEIRIWPGARDLFDIERERLPDVEPLVEGCTLATSPCGDDGGVELVLRAQDEAHILVTEGALGDYGEPLQLEILGTLSDNDGRRKKVSFFFDFQVVREAWVPGGDTSGGGDASLDEPLEVGNGYYLFFAEFNLDGLELAQQFFSSLAVDQETGDFLFILVDADPNEAMGAIDNTSKPEELVMDFGMEGFVFTAWGRVTRTDTGLEYETVPVNLAQNIAGIQFELQNIVLRGRVVQDEETGLWEWDGTMAVTGVVLTVGNKETVYPENFSNISLRELTPEQVPEDIPEICEADICDRVEGGCDLPPDTSWPPPQYCE